MKNVFGVGLIDEPQSQSVSFGMKKLQEGRETVVQPNYRKASLAEKRCILFNSIALEGHVLMSLANDPELDDFEGDTNILNDSFDGGYPVTKGKSVDEFRDELNNSMLQFFKILSDSGSISYQIFNFRAKY